MNMKYFMIVMMGLCFMALAVPAHAAGGGGGGGGGGATYTGVAAGIRNDAHQCSAAGSISYDGCTVHLTACCDPSPYMVGGLRGVGTTAEANTPVGAADFERTIQVVPRIFSSVTCQVESLMGQVFGTLWCSIRDSIRAPLAAALMLYVVITGMVFTLGLRPMKVSDLAIAVFKMAMVWFFATEADFAIGILYRFYMYVLKDGIALVLSAGFGDTAHGSGYIMHNLDALFSQVFQTNPQANETRAGGALMAMMAMIAVPVVGPILGPAIVGVSIMTFMVFIRTILSYLIAITGLAFFLSLGPIFLGFALFKQTQSVFQNWLTQIISFSLQPVIIFAYLMMIEAYMPNFIGDMVVVDKVVGVADVQPDANNANPGGTNMTANIPQVVLRRSGADVGDTESDYFDPQMVMSGDLGALISLLGSVGGMALLNFATVKFLEMVPNLARQLTSMGGRALKIGGGADDRSFGRGIRAPGENALQNTMARIQSLSNQGADQNTIAREAVRTFVGDFASRFSPQGAWQSQWWGSSTYNPDRGYGGSMGRVIETSERTARARDLGISVQGVGLSNEQANAMRTNNIGGSLVASQDSNGTLTLRDGRRIDSSGNLLPPQTAR